jgi:hypothetical protein
LPALAVRLSLEDLGEIDAMLLKVAIQGARYPEHLQKLVGR